jgi:twin BRCT domain
MELSLPLFVTTTPAVAPRLLEFLLVELGFRVLSAPLRITPVRSIRFLTIWCTISPLLHCVLLAFRQHTRSRIWLLASAFGARCVKEVDESVTHLVATQRCSCKAKKARACKNRIHIVRPQWLLASVEVGSWPPFGC